MPIFVTVASFISPWDAHIAKGLLESEGIPVVIRNEHHVSVNWTLSNALGGVLLQVTEENANRAQKVLESVHTGEPKQAIKQQFPDMVENVCPQCTSLNIKSRFPIGTIILLVFTLGFTGIIFPPRRKNHTCLECGSEWKY